MSVKSFKFVSPGVFINEIDNSFRPREQDAIGPVVVGRASRGISMRPVAVESYSEFVEGFGDTVPGMGSGDIYRDGNYQSPMYGTYAAKAFLNANVAPLTYVRLLGQQSSVNDGTADAQAGWQTTGNPVNGTAGGGAFGLFIANSGSNGIFTGSTYGFHLGAIIYVESGSVMLSGGVAGPTGSAAGVDVIAQASSCVINSDSTGGFNLVISGSRNGEKNFYINLQDTTSDFIRKRLNTNPLLASTAGTFYDADSHEDYWLGETFEQYVRSKVSNLSSNLMGVVIGLASGSADDTGPHKMKGKPSQEAVAGWFIGQDLGEPVQFIAENSTKLFRLIGRGHGEWLHKNVKVSIENIRQSTSTSTEYGTFSVVLRAISDTDNAIQVLERYDNCNLNPASPDFISRKIGDMYEEWDNTERRLKRYNAYPNKSKYVRVETTVEIEDGSANASLLPFGYFGPPKFRDLSETIPFSGSAVAGSLAERFFTAGTTLPGVGHPHAQLLISSSWSQMGAAGAAGEFGSGSFFFPTDDLRATAEDGGLSDQTKAYFGFRTTRTATSTANDVSTTDNHRLLYIDLGQDNNVPVDVSTSTYNTSASSGISGRGYVFTMDDVSGSALGGGGVYSYSSGSRRAGTSTSAKSGNSYLTLLNANINKFTAPFWGGFDGVDITKPDPFYNAGMSSGTETNNYAFYTIKRAIDTVADPEYLDMNLLSVPGLTNDTLTGHMIDVCEERADALAVIDLSNVYIPPHEAYYSDKTSRIPASPVSRANDLKDRRIDSSYGCTFYPWVQTRDDNTGQLVWIPPSVAMMGVFASSERKSAVWFAPAGFNRG